MRKRFNDTGVCIAERHFMADTSEKMAQLIELVEDGAYFTISRPRQYGKTTSIHSLFIALNQRPDYLAIQISLEGIGDAIFENEAVFCHHFIDELAYRLEKTHPSYAEFLQEQVGKTNSLKQLSRTITRFVDHCSEKVVLLVDEIDKSSNNQLFLSFLGMLRDKYLDANRDLHTSFQSVILAGVHDIKSLKLKIAPGAEGKLNSPSNIAIDFNIDMRFNPREIEAMLIDYTKARNVEMDTALVAEKIYYYTAGYPYLVSKICKVADEDLDQNGEPTNWHPNLIDLAFRYLVDEGYTTTLFDDLVKNLENNSDLYQLVFDISFNGKTPAFNVLDPVINLGVLYGILGQKEGRCHIHNRIFEQKIYAYILSKQNRKADLLVGVSPSRFFNHGQLDLQAVLSGFQQFMKENYAQKDSKFLEREGRLLFLSYLKPIINGRGFDFKEPSIAEERRMDVVVTYNNQRNVVELKRWEGEAYHQKGLAQLSNYLDSYSLTQGFLLIFDFRKNKTYKTETISFQGKEIFAVWV